MTLRDLLAVDVDLELKSVEENVTGWTNQKFVFMMMVFKYEIFCINIILITFRKRYNHTKLLGFL